MKEFILRALRLSAIALAILILLISAVLVYMSQTVTPQLVIPGTPDKTTYQEVKILAATPQGVKIEHAAGVSTIPVASLLKGLLAKYVPISLATPSEEPEPSGKAKGIANPVASVSSFDPACLVFITTDTGRGSGFIAQADGKTYVYSNAHVICGQVGGFTSKIVNIKTASGRTIPTPTELELSGVTDLNSDKGLEDVIRFPITLQAGESAYEISSIDSNTDMNSKVIAYGNSLGGDVFTSLSGVIMGLGSDRIEISCEIVPGNSGGPVVLEQTKKVIGISSYLGSGQRDIWAKGTAFANIRRFALRPEKITQWRKLLYSNLMSSTAELNAFARDTLSLAAACYLNPKPNNAGFATPAQSRGDYQIRTILVDGGRYPLGRTISASIAKVNQRLGGSGNSTRLSAQVTKPQFADFFNTVAQASSAQMQSMQNSDRAPYLKKLIPDLIRERNEVHNTFVQQAERFK